MDKILNEITVRGIYFVTCDPEKGCGLTVFGLAPCHTEEAFRFTDWGLAPPNPPTALASRARTAYKCLVDTFEFEDI